jgi:quinol-cytochrome oxidoreductase complex cytochrome b subunit
MKERLERLRIAIQNLEIWRIFFGGSFQDKRSISQKLVDYLLTIQIFNSIFRHGLPDTEKNKALTIISNVALHLHPVKVRESGLKFTYTFCLGGISLFLFIILTITGILLMFYYIPDTAKAYDCIKDLEFVVSFGQILRNIHRWAAHGMVLCVVLHMIRVFLTGAYKPPREFNWVVGVMLLILTLFLSFTGYILPWDQLAFWAVTIGSNMAASTPFLGHKGPFKELLNVAINNDIRFTFFGGTIIGQNTLIRFYVLHCVVLPLLMVILLAIHFWRIRKDGGISGRRL